MCDLQTSGRRGWRGWRSFPAARMTRATGEWHDLTHCFHDELPVPHVFEHPRVKRVMKMPEGKLNVTRFEVTVHACAHGTDRTGPVVPIPTAPDGAPHNKETQPWLK